MRSARLATNLLAVALVSAVLLLYAFSSLLAGALTDDTYPLEVVLPESGGLIEAQEVTLSGRVIGRVQSVRLEGEGVVARLGIQHGQQVPSDVQVTVLRRSPIGEQALDFRPQSVGSDFLEPGARITALEAVTPVPVQRLLEKADAVLAPVDGERLGVVVRELADAVRGRRDEIRALMTDGADFSETLAVNQADIERFFAHSATVNAALADSREALARSIGQMATASETLVDMRADFEGLLREAPPVLGQIEDLVAPNQANLACVFSDLGDLNTYLAEPEQIDAIEESLRLNQWFFKGAELGGPRDFEGRVWTRIKFLPPQEQHPDSYLPDKRPIPDILPGAACESPVGPGVPAASQAGYEKRVPDAELVPPEGRTAAIAPPVDTAPASQREDSQLLGSLALLLALATAAMAGRAVRRVLAKGRT